MKAPNATEEAENKARQAATDFGFRCVSLGPETWTCGTCTIRGIETLVSVMQGRVNPRQTNTPQGGQVWTALILTAAGCHKNTVSRDEVIHKDGKPCPTGWTETPEFFEERSGSKVSDCVAGHDTPDVNWGAVDELRGGEGMGFTIRIPAPYVAPDRKRI